MTKLLEALTLAEEALETAKWFDNPHWIERAEKSLAATREQKVELEKQAEQEPVARVASEHTHSKYASMEVLVDHRLPCNTKLYAAPQPVQQVDLDDDEIDAIADYLVAPLPTVDHLRDFARAVIAKLREKECK